MNNKICNFGEHYMLDCYQGEYEKLNDRDLILKILDELPEKLEMHKLSKPQVFEAQDNDIKDSEGWSGFVVIAESHITYFKK